MVRKILLSLVVVLSVAFSGFAQKQQVSGSVSDTSGSPIVGATIVVDGTHAGTTTGTDGSFAIAVPKNGTIVVSYIGFKSQMIPVAGKSNFKIVLSEDSTALDDVVVVAYGTTTKEAFTGSAGVVKSDELAKRQVSDITNALAGAVAGVQTLSSNGQPGVSSKVLIRGIGSINAGTSPLYVVDGVAFDGEISSIASSDIETITVLKDAASTAMYGARGANGVIMVTTKRGKVGKSVINFDAKVGVNSRQIKNYDVMTSPEMYLTNLYTVMNNQYLAYGKDESTSNAYANEDLFNGNYGGTGCQIYTTPDGEYLFGMDGKINPNSTLGYSDGDNYYTPDNWADGTFSNNTRQEYTISTSGASANTSYYVSFGYLNDGGVVNGSGFERYSTRASLDHVVKSWLKVGANLGYSYSDSSYPGEQTNSASSGNAFWLANFIAPVYPMYIRDAEGEIMTVNGKKVYDYGDGSYSACSRNFMSIANPASDLLYNTTEYLSDIFNATWYAELTPVKGLSITARYGLNVDGTRYNDLGNAYFGQSAAYGGTAYQASTRTAGFTQQYVADYNFDINDDSNLDLMVAYDGYSWTENVVSAYGTKLYHPDSYYVNNAINGRIGYGEGNSYSTQGYIARASYSLMDTYFATLSFRRDASSRFAADNRWGNFWSASAAWIISNEDFMSNVDFIDMLKMKASYGEQGNDAIGNYYAYADQYQMTGSDGIFADGTLIYKGNPDLTWETSVAANVGFDFAMFKNKLSGSLEYFQRQSNDMLYMLPTSPTLGYTEKPVNVGSMRNAGVELALDYNIFNTKDFQWNVSANITSINNKIISLHEDLDGELKDGSRIYTEGESMYNMYLTEWAGVNDETGVAEYWSVDDATGERVKTSDYEAAYASARISTGDLLADAYGGFSTSIAFKGFDASVQMSYQFGGQIYDSGYATLMHNGYYQGSTAGYNWHMDILDAWTPENKTSDIPRLCSADKFASNTSTRFLVSSNYLALNNITFGYTIPKSITSRYSIDKFRIYVAADNVALWSAREGLDPRQSFTSATTAIYTPIRTISGGVNIAF